MALMTVAVAAAVAAMKKAEAENHSRERNRSKLKYTADRVCQCLYFSIQIPPCTHLNLAE